MDPQLEAIIETMLTLDISDPRFMAQYSYLKGQLDMIRGMFSFEEDVLGMAAEADSETEVREGFIAKLKEKMKSLYLKVIWRMR